MKRKLAFVVQRYGLEVNGGAEALSRELVEHLRDFYEIDVLTTKAVEYTTWKDFYEEDETSINGIHVKRFSIEKPRNVRRFTKQCRKVLGNTPHTMDDEIRWFDEQGPYTPALIEYIRRHGADYDIFVFMTYLYYTTVKGLPIVRDKSILIPTAHDEPPIYLRTFKKLFMMPKACFYLTTEEKRFVEKTFNNGHIINNDGQGGSGVVLPETIDRQRLRIKDEQIKKQLIQMGNQPDIEVRDYIVYTGRIDEMKGCQEMFSFFEQYKEEHKNKFKTDLKLVLMGKPVISIPKRDDIISLGFVDEQMKYDVMAGAKFLWMPSPYESLSMVVLESLGMGVPVLCNGNCMVLKGHCVKSNAGLYYRNYEEFAGCMDYMLHHDEQVKVMGEQGKAYIARYYTWDRIIECFRNLVEQIDEKE